MSQRLVVVDGYNLILRAPELKPGPGRTLEQAREKLVSLLGWAVGSGDAEFVVVFDGAEGVGVSPSGGRVRVRYSRPPQKADDLIRALVEEKVERGVRVSVVSSDLEVARHARAMGADVALSDLFLASLFGPAREPSGEGADKPGPPSRKELEEWAALFEKGKEPPEE